MSKLVTGVIPAVAALVLFSLPVRALAQSGLQTTPDGRRVLISKDVADSRFAISQNRDDGSVTGNVFSSSGGEPQFIWCSNLVPGSDPVNLDCYGTLSCAEAPCAAAAWQSLGVIQLPESFFLPRAASGLGKAQEVDHRAGEEAGRASGVQISLDSRRVLISKDVNGERWSITLNLDDRTVSGNVFSPGKDPSFLFCQQKSIDGDEVTLSCSAAAKCAGASCSPDDWTFLAEVTLPGSFFRPPSPTGDAKAGCVATARAGDLASASVVCGAAALANPGDGEVALIRSVTDPVTEAFESASVLDLLAALGVSVRGSAFDVCAIGVLDGAVERDSKGAPKVPRTGQIQQVVAQELGRVTDVALARAAAVPTANGIRFELANLPPCLRAFDTKVADVDETDLKAFTSFAELLAGIGHVAAAYDVDIDLGSAIDDGSSFADLFLANPNAFTLPQSGSSELLLARTAFDSSLRDFVATIDLARAETDDQSDDVLVVARADDKDVDRDREVANKIRTSLTGEATFEASKFNLPADQTLVLGPFFEGRLSNIRPLFPINGAGEGDLCHLPDPTLDGILPDLTQDVLDQVLFTGCGG